ncbi:cupin domain-containing protein [Paenibacillus daejeonensis]|uniref:cupin domain-containing protein n=1 Tax=Paenibacillus daejeonensis TaxID=135193 RepID=UPI00035C407C|nr:cupin domain-containing protein [Paenibacillus daejeonensis]
MYTVPQAPVYPNAGYPYNPWQAYPVYRQPAYPYYVQAYPAQYPFYSSPYPLQPSFSRPRQELTDHGKEPFVVNIEQATKQNDTFRTAIWTGEHFQVTLMSIPAGEDIGLEVHPSTDQFIRIEEGQGLVQMGDTKEKLNYEMMAHADDAIMVPAGKWHNLTNMGNTPLKVYVIYAPPEHPRGTVHVTKADALAAHE